MHTAYPIALAVCACAWLLPAAGSLAQSAAPLQAGAADPGASVPATTYQSAIGYRPEAGPGTPPDHRWVESNAAVAAYDSMSLTMKMKGMRAPADPHAAHAGHDEHAGHAMHADAARPAAPPAESP